MKGRNSCGYFFFLSDMEKDWRIERACGKIW